MRSYVDLARALPPPSEEQTRQFAAFLTSDHIWYRLPIYPPSPFVFFLDPNSGTERVLVPNSGFAFVDRYVPAALCFWSHAQQVRAIDRADGVADAA